MADGDGTGFFGSVAGKLLDAATGGLISVAAAAVPQHVKRQVQARIADYDPFGVIAGNHDLIRAARIAWVEAASEVLKAARAALRAGMRDGGEDIHRFMDIAEAALEAERHAAFDRRRNAGRSAIDTYLLTVLRGTSEFVSPGADGAIAEPLTDGFVPTLAALTSWPESEIPPLLGSIARSGVTMFGGGASRDFGTLVFAAFAELLKDPGRYPEARTALLIEANNAVRHLAEQTLEAVKGLDEALDGRLREAIETQRGWIRGLVDAGLRRLLGITDLRLGVDASSPRARQAIRNRPTEVLVSRYRIVPFLDRNGTLAAALEWARAADGASAQGRLYVAPGGFGKTRFALELAETLADEGWRCVVLSGRNAGERVLGTLPAFLGDPDARGVLVVLDYADGQIPLLRAVATAAAGLPDDAPPVRVLALARSAEGWWDHLAADSDMAMVFEPAPRVEIETSLTDAEATELRDRATEAFTRALAAAGVPPPQQGGRRFDLSGRPFDRPLTVAMAAYLSARGEQDDPQLSVFARVFNDERGHWQRALGLSDVAGNDPRLSLLGRAAAQVTLVQGASNAGAAALMAADPAQARNPGRQDEVLAALERLYGGIGPVELRPIEPDLLGEHAAMAVLQEDRDGLLEATLHTALSGPPLFARDPALILTVLLRALREEHDAATRAAAQAAIERIGAATGTMDAVAIRRLEAALPQFAVPFLRLAAAIARRVADTAGEDRAEEARALNNLAVRLSETGDRSGALGPSRRAVEIREALSGENPAAYLPDLASSLNNLASFLSETGDRSGALGPARRAVEISEALSVENPAAYLPGLAMSLNNLAMFLSETGDRSGALGPARRAVEIREALSVENPAAYLPDLASSLNNLASFLSETGDRSGALGPARRAVEISEALSVENPAAYLPALASSLNNLAIRLSETGDRSGALGPARRAVEISEALSDENPAAYLPGLAMSLNNLAGFLSETGDRSGALGPARRAVEIYEALSVENPAAYLPALAMSLNNLASSLSETGDRSGALGLARRAVEIYEALSGENPAAYLPDLASSLNNLASFLSETGDRSGALGPARRAVEIREALSGENPAAYLPDLAMSLWMVADVTRAADDLDAAIAAYQRSLIAFRTCFEALPQRFAPNLMVVAQRLADVLRQVRRDNEIEPKLSAVLGDEILQAMGEAQPDAFSAVPRESKDDEEAGGSSA